MGTSPEFWKILQRKMHPDFVPEKAECPFQERGCCSPRGTAAAAGPLRALHSPRGCSVWRHHPRELSFGGDTAEDGSPRGFWVAQTLCGPRPQVSVSLCVSLVLAAEELFLSAECKITRSQSALSISSISSTCFLFLKPIKQFNWEMGALELAF